MVRNDIKLNIIFNESPISEEEKDKRLIDFFAVLFEWKLEERKNNEKKI